MAISSVRRSEGVRFGGCPGRDGYVFELSGGRLSLDFINTLDHRPSPRPRELLAGYADLVSWSRQAGILAPRQSRKLVERAGRERARARRALGRARKLREALFEIFSAVARGRPAPARALAMLQSRLASAYATPEIVPNAGYALVWRDDRTTFESLLSPIVRSAVDLLTAPEADRVRLCAAEDCAWVFLDESRNRSRQWCDMTVCGNRAKARRFYSRRRELKRRRDRRATPRVGGKP